MVDRETFEMLQRILPRQESVLADCENSYLNMRNVVTDTKLRIEIYKLGLGNAEALKDIICVRNRNHIEVVLCELDEMVAINVANKKFARPIVYVRKINANGELDLNPLGIDVDDRACLTGVCL